MEIKEHATLIQHSPSGAKRPGGEFGCLRQWFRPRAYLGWIACDGVRCVLGFLREGVGDLGRNWLEKTSRSRHIETALYCDELEDERLNVLQIMAVKLVAA